jgi:hypothetical protein
VIDSKEGNNIQFNVLIERLRAHHRALMKRCPSQKKLEAWFEKEWGARTQLLSGKQGWKDKAWVDCLL